MFWTNTAVRIDILRSRGEGVVRGARCRRSVGGGWFEAMKLSSSDEIMSINAVNLRLLIKLRSAGKYKPLPKESVEGGGAEDLRVGMGPRSRSNVVPPGGCFLGGIAGGRSSSPQEGVRDPAEEEEDRTFSCD